MLGALDHVRSIHVRSTRGNQILNEIVENTFSAHAARALRKTVLSAPERSSRDHPEIIQRSSRDFPEIVQRLSRDSMHIVSQQRAARAHGLEQEAPERSSRDHQRSSRDHPEIVQRLSRDCSEIACMSQQRRACTASSNKKLHVALLCCGFSTLQSFAAPKRLLARQNGCQK